MKKLSEKVVSVSCQCQSKKELGIPLRAIYFRLRH